VRGDGKQECQRKGPGTVEVKNQQGIRKPKRKEGKLLLGSMFFWYMPQNRTTLMNGGQRGRG